MNVECEAGMLVDDVATWREVINFLLILETKTASRIFDNFFENSPQTHTGSEKDEKAHTLCNFYLKISI